jgi:hypothetical protein
MNIHPASEVSCTLVFIAFGNLTVLMTIAGNITCIKYTSDPGDVYLTLSMIYNCTRLCTPRVYVLLRLLLIH